MLLYNVLKHSAKIIRLYTFLFLISFLLLSPLNVHSSILQKNKPLKFTIEEVASNLNIPWGMSFINDSEIIFTQKSGSVGVLNTKTQKIRWLTGIPKVMDEGQGGLLDVAVHPNKDSIWIYFTYVKEIQEEGVTALGRAKLNNNHLHSWKDLLVTQSRSNTSRHFGSRITFDDRNHLFFTVGDRGIRSNAQDLTTHAGSIIRLHLDGTIPKDNPFINHPTALPEIYSYGHRNPQGLAYDKNNQKLYAIEHGPRGGDEINLIEKGKNYGWPIISYGKEYWNPMPVGIGTHKKGMEQPIKIYTPSIAPSSLLIYTNPFFKQWKGNLFAGALKMQHLNQIVMDKQGNAVKEIRLLQSLKERVRAIAQSPEGWIYFSTDSGRILRIKPNYNQ